MLRKSLHKQEAIPHGLKSPRENSTYELSTTGVCLSFPNKGRVPHISLVFREMWDSTALSL
jgi:hypothetical protein